MTFLVATQVVRVRCPNEPMFRWIGGLEAVGEAGDEAGEGVAEADFEVPRYLFSD